MVPCCKCCMAPWMGFPIQVVCVGLPVQNCASTNSQSFLCMFALHAFGSACPPTGTFSSAYTPPVAAISFFFFYILVNCGVGSWGTRGIASRPQVISLFFTAQRGKVRLGLLVLHALHLWLLVWLTLHLWLLVWFTLHL